MYKLFVRDQYFNIVAEVDYYTNLDIIMRFNAVGSWVLELPTNTEAGKLLMDKKAGIVLKKDGNILMSGPVTGFNRKWDKDGDRLMVNGADDLIYLQRNLAFSVPLGPFFNTQDYDVRTGKAETIMKQYVDANIGVNGSPRRQIGITSQVDAGLGKTTIGRARFQTLLELLSSIALVGGDLGFRVVQKNNALEFQVYQPANKSQNVVFSPGLGNLAAFEYSTEDPETNYVVIGGGGEGKDRLLLTKIDSQSAATYGRIETFMDRRDVTDNIELFQAMDEELQEKANKYSLSITPIDTELLAFGTDYNLGDKVTVIITDSNQTANLKKITDIVREIKISFNQNGVSIAPTVGTPESISRKPTSIYKMINKVKKRLSNLERS